MDKSQINAISLFQDGEYEKAIEAMAKSSTVSPEEFKSFVAQCNQILAEQYKYLINEALSERNYTKANSLRDDFLRKHGKNAAIEALPIPSVPPFLTSTKKSSIPTAPTERKIIKSKTVYYIIGGVIVLAIALIIWVISSSSDDSTYNSESDYNNSYNQTVEEEVDTVAIEEVPESEYNSYESPSSNESQNTYPNENQNSYQDDYSDFE